MWNYDKEYIVESRRDEHEVKKILNDPSWLDQQDRKWIREYNIWFEHIGDI